MSDQDITSPVISILLPVKNAEQYLRDCITSILHQSFTRWELIAVDDHSSDKSRLILDHFSLDDNRITVIENPGYGIIDALRHSYRQARGTYITRMDADDLMGRDKLHCLYQALRKNGRGFLSIAQVSYFSDDDLGEGYKNYAKWLNALTLQGKNFTDIYRECTIPSPCWMVHRKDLDLAGAFTSNIYPEDYDLAFRFRKARLKIAPVQKILHHWRDYPHRTSRTHPHYADNRFSALKVSHFIDQDLNTERRLILWGAGNKGKSIAREFNHLRQPFAWICNNPRKIGKEIYGVTLKGLSFLEQSNNAQVIMAVSSPKHRESIERTKESHPQHEFFRFA